MVVLALAAGLSAGSHAAVLVNPGFETGDFTGWQQFGQGWRVSDFPGDAHEGTYGAVNDVLNGHVDEWRGIYQNLPAHAGQVFFGGVWIRAIGLLDSVSWFELQFHDINGNVIAQYQSAHVAADQPFTFMGITNTVAPVGTTTVSVRGIVHMLSAPTPGPSFHIFDQFEFGAQSVPEPATLILFGGAGAMLRTLRRRARDELDRKRGDGV